MIKLTFIDLTIYLACIIAIGVSIYAIQHTGALLDTCNIHWQNNFNNMCVYQNDYGLPKGEFNINDLNFSLNSS